jgi:hypothetical protein
MMMTVIMVLGRVGGRCWCRMCCSARAPSASSPSSSSSSSTGPTCSRRSECRFFVHHESSQSPVSIAILTGWWWCVLLKPTLTTLACFQVFKPVRKHEPMATFVTYVLALVAIEVSHRPRQTLEILAVHFQSRSDACHKSSMGTIGKVASTVLLKQSAPPLPFGTGGHHWLLALAIGVNLLKEP